MQGYVKVGTVTVNTLLPESNGIKRNFERNLTKIAEFLRNKPILFKHIMIHVLMVLISVCFWYYQIGSTMLPLVQ